MTPRLAIAMTTYNGATYLPQQLASFAAQTRLPDHLVACDDGSSDDTIFVLEAFAASAPFPVTIVRNATNLGHERNFGQAIALARGDIILLSDQDDRWDADKLATVEREFADHPDTLLIVNDVRITDGDLQPNGRTLLGQMRSSGLIGLNNRGLLIGCGTSFRAAFRALALPVPALDYGHDTWVNEFAAMLGAKRIIDRPLQDYRRHASNVSYTSMEGGERATARTLLAPGMGQDLTAAWQKQIDAFSEMKRRVDALDDFQFAALRIGRSRAEVSRQLAEAIAAVTRRSRVFRRGAIGKRLLAVELLMRGDYRYFSGWRSFAKDLIR